MSVDLDLYTHEPVSSDAWRRTAAECRLSMRIDPDVGITVTDLAGQACGVIGEPEDIDSDERAMLPDPAHLRLCYHACEIRDAAMATLLRKVADAVGGCLYDTQADEWYPYHLNRTSRDEIDEEAASAEAWVSRLPSGWAAAHKVAVIVRVVAVVTLLVGGIGIVIAERRAGGRFSSGVNTTVTAMMVGLIVFVVLAEFAHAIVADAHDAQVRRAARDWLASLAEAPQGLPHVFVRHFQPYRIRRDLAVVAAVVACLLIPGGIVYAFMPEAPQPRLVWGALAVVVGIPIASRSISMPISRDPASGMSACGCSTSAWPRSRPAGSWRPTSLSTAWKTPSRCRSPSRRGNTPHRRLLLPSKVTRASRPSGWSSIAGRCDGTSTRSPAGPT